MSQLTNDNKTIKDIISYFCNCNKPIGRTQLQKLVFLLKEMENIDVSYDYEIHCYYGIYSLELAKDLDYLSFFGKINLKTSYSSYCGVEITINNKKYSAEIARKIENIEKKISAVFGTEDPFKIRNLEIINTLIFMSSIYCDDKKILEEFFELKPGFDKDFVMNHYSKIKELFFINKYDAICA